MEEKRRIKTRKTNESKQKRKFPWKWLFLALLAINIGTAAFIGSRAFTTRNQASLNSSINTQKDSKVATIDSSTEQVNQLINGYIQSYQSKDMTYKFYLSNQAVLEASYKLFGQKIPLYVYFEPLALSDGSVSLKVTSVSVGTLSLPTTAVLGYIKSSVKLPNFVQVESSKNQIIINLPKLALASNLYLKTNQIDLVNQKFSFDLMQKV
jgi:uncharacterized protein YpmS